MSAVENLDDFDVEDCLCQAKVIPEDKRIDFLEVRETRDGKLKWTTVLRYHKDCPIHGIKVTYAERTKPATVQRDRA